MIAIANRAFEQFVAQIRDEVVFAQVLIRRAEAGFELRHVTDAAAATASLRTIGLSDVRALAQFAGGGAFRPLKSAPNLQTGWLLRGLDDPELEVALNNLYPGAIADWYAAQSPQPPVTGYREFTARQTGMYRMTARLTNAQAAPVIRATCHRRFCLKQRLWTVPGLATDAQPDKSLIPCLEPCAILLEFARTAMRIGQEDKIHLDLAPGEIAGVIAALLSAMENSAPAVREADFSAPLNPRRLQFILETLKPQSESGQAGAVE
jgi:hypothetical protein